MRGRVSDRRPAGLSRPAVGGCDRLVVIREVFPVSVDILDYDDLADEFMEILEAMD